VHRTGSALAPASVGLDWKSECVEPLCIPHAGTGDALLAFAAQPGKPPSFYWRLKGVPLPQLLLLRRPGRAAWKGSRLRASTHIVRHVFQLLGGLHSDARNSFSNLKPGKTKAKEAIGLL
jgi:hypothetical protein